MSEKNEYEYMTNLNSFPIFLSASIPQGLVETNRAQGMFDLLVALAGGILSNSGILVYGGHPSITPIIYKVAMLAGAEQQEKILLFQLNRFRKFVPQEIQEIFKNIQWFGADENNIETLSDDLSQMREAMVKASRAGIFIGGKAEQFLGKKPGIRDEYERFLKYHSDCPVYLVGMLEGEVLNIINDPEEQVRHKNLNSLQEEEIIILRSSNNPDLIASIILRDLQRQLEQ